MKFPIYILLLFVSPLAAGQTISGVTNSNLQDTSDPLATREFMADNLSGNNGMPEAILTLPAELISFEGSMTGNAVTLQWATSTEINNDFFTLERSKDGFNFTAFATLQGAGNSNQMLSYEEIDKNFFQGSTYYRLKQTGFDGKIVYSEIIYVATH